jgi:hypothetical protein
MGRRTGGPADGPADRRAGLVRCLTPFPFVLPGGWPRLPCRSAPMWGERRPADPTMERVRVISHPLMIIRSQIFGKSQFFVATATFEVVKGTANPPFPKVAAPDAGQKGPTSLERLVNGRTVTGLGAYLASRCVNGPYGCCSAPRDAETAPRRASAIPRPPPVTAPVAPRPPPVSAPTDTHGAAR